jgi:hypothetical protein
MKCAEAQDLILRKIDLELSEAESGILKEHMDHCAGCTRRYRMMHLPRQIAEMSAPPVVSPYFMGTLRNRIENEARDAAFIQQFLGLARSFIPSLAAFTLALVSVFTYLHLISPPADLGTAYRRMFLSENIPMNDLIVERQNITDANILSAIANSESWRQESAKPDNGTH